MPKEKILNVNPFEDSFVKKEIAFCGFKETPVSDEGVCVKVRPLIGQCDDYLNRNWRIGDITVPMFFIDGELWMSLTPMEIQSAFVPLQLAAGEVGTAGLGMGYFTLRCAQNPDVKSVTVFEKDSRVIDFFLKNFGSRPETKKVKIIEGDARETLRGFEFDFLFVDIYQTLLPDEIPSDIILFTRNNYIGEDNISAYHFWGYEKVVLDAMMMGILPRWGIPEIYKEFFALWSRTDIGVDKTKLVDMYSPGCDEEYARRILSRLDWGLEEE